MRAVTVVVLLYFSVAYAAAAQDWVAYTTDNFTIYSDARESKIMPIVREFEAFRLVALSVLGLPDVPESRELVIVAFDRSREFTELSPRRAGGFFYHSIYGPRMFVGPASEDSTREILFHEYVHYLMNQHSPANYPRWYSEGMADLLSSTQISLSGIHIGRAPNQHKLAFSTGFSSSVEDVVDMEPDGMDYGFYVKSWLLTHYLMFGDTDGVDRRSQTADFLRRYDAGEDPLTAFPAAFGVTPDEMERELIGYARGSKIGGLQSAPIAYEGQLTQRPLDDGEHLYLLGNLAVEISEHEAAHDYFDEFGESADATSPFADNVKSRRAIALIHDDRVTEGDALIDELINTALEDPDVVSDVAHYAFDRYIYEIQQGGDVDRVHLERAIRYGERAIDSPAPDLEAQYYLGLSYEVAGELQKAVDTLLLAYETSPSESRLNQALARVLIKGKQPDLASYLMGRLLSASHSDEFRATLREMITAIRTDDYDADAIASRLSTW